MPHYLTHGAPGMVPKALQPGEHKMHKAQKLIADATAAGRRIEQQSTRTVIWFGRDDGVIVNEDRTMTRLMMNSNRITDTQARHILRIK